MLNPLFDAIRDLVSAVMPYDIGSSSFYIVAGICILAWVIVARVFMGLMKSDKGFISACIGLCITVIAGLLGYGLAKWQLSPLISADWADSFVPLLAFAVISFLTILFGTKRFFGLSGGVSIFIFVFATCGSIAGYFAATVALETIEKGGGQIKEREERKNEAIDSVL